MQVELRQASKQWDDGTYALENIDLMIQAGEFFGIVGPSGSGKSTLLRVIAGLEQPEYGRVLYDGIDVTQVRPENRKLGHVPQGTSLYTHMTAEGNLGFPLLARKVGRDERQEQVQEHAERFGLRRLLSRKPSQLSAGQQHLVAAGRATVLDQPLLLLDEPFATIDRPARARVKRQLTEIAAPGRTVVLATNDQAEAFSLCDRIALIREGRVVQVGRPIDLYEQPRNVFVAEFIGDPAMNTIAALARGDALAIGDDHVVLPRPAPRSGTVIVGIRPEHARPSQEGSPFTRCVHGRVTLVEALGDHSLVHLAFGGPDSGALDFVIRMDAPATPSVGDRLEVEWDVEKLHFFDHDTHRRLAWP